MTPPIAARVAFATSITNVAASIVMLAVLRHGIPAGEPSIEDRFIFIRTHTSTWRWGWLVWMVAALTLLCLFVALAERWNSTSPILCMLAVALATAGIAADLAGESFLALLLPRETTDFDVVDRIAHVLTSFLANGLYTLAGIALTIAGARELPRSLVALAAATWASGLALSGAVFVGSRRAEFVSGAAVMTGIIAWTFLLGLWLRNRKS